MPGEKFIQWMKAATPAEQNELALLAATSRSMLYQLQYSKDKGGRQASSELAGRIEEAAHVMGSRGERLPALTRGDLNAACAACPYHAPVGRDSLRGVVHDTLRDVLHDARRYRWLKGQTTATWVELAHFPAERCETIIDMEIDKETGASNK